MKTLITTLILLSATICFADVKLYEFIDSNNNVIGISYSDKNGNIIAPIGTTAKEISENQKNSEILKQRTYEKSIQYKGPSLEERVSALEKKIGTN